MKQKIVSIQTNAICNLNNTSVFAYKPKSIKCKAETNLANVLSPVLSLTRSLLDPSCNFVISACISADYVYSVVVSSISFACMTPLT